jgi:hypothetical protein
MMTSQLDGARTTAMITKKIKEDMKDVLGLSTTNIKYAEEEDQDLIDNCELFRNLKLADMKDSTVRDHHLKIKETLVDAYSGLSGLKSELVAFIK